MAQEIPMLEATKRDSVGTRAAQRERKSGRLPAVIYGHKQNPTHVSLDYKDAIALLLERAHLLNVQHDGETESCLVKAVQWDGLGDRIAHVDLERVNLSETVTVEIEVELVGDAVGLKEDGAFLEQPNTTVEIECTAGNIPDGFTLEVTALGVGDSLTVADLTLPEGVTAVSDPETVLAAIHMAKAEEEPEEAEAADGAEPELVGHDDKDKDKDDKDDDK